MKVRQISVFLENKCGRLAEVTQTLGRNGVNIRALSIADTSDFGILRLITNVPDKACKVLREANYTVSENEVIAVEIEDAPGGLAQCLQAFENCEVNLEYMYAFVGASGKNAVVVFKVPDVDWAVEALAKQNVRFLSGEEVYSL